MLDAISENQDPDLATFPTARYTCWRVGCCILKTGWVTNNPMSFNSLLNIHTDSNIQPFMKKMLMTCIACSWQSWVKRKKEKKMEVRLVQTSITIDEHDLSNVWF